MGTRLPYEFDLLYDIKTVEELYRVLNHEPHCTDATIPQLEISMRLHNIPFPENYAPGIRKDFPIVVWIDNNGGYITYAPTVEEASNYQRMHLY